LNESPRSQGAAAGPLTAEADAAASVSTTPEPRPGGSTALLKICRNATPKSRAGSGQIAVCLHELAPPTATRNAIGFGQRTAWRCGRHDDRRRRTVLGGGSGGGVEPGPCSRAGDALLRTSGGSPPVRRVKRGLREAYEDIYGLTNECCQRGPKIDVRKVKAVISLYPTPGANDWCVSGRK